MIRAKTITRNRTSNDRLIALLSCHFFFLLVEMHPRKTLLHFIYCRGGTQFCSCLLLYSLVILFLIIFWTVGFTVYQHLSSAIIFSTMFPTVSSLHSWHNSSHLQAQRWQWNTMFSGSILCPTLHAVCCICQVHSEQVTPESYVPCKELGEKELCISWPLLTHLRTTDMRIPIPSWSCWPTLLPANKKIFCCVDLHTCTLFSGQGVVKGLRWQR